MKKLIILFLFVFVLISACDSGGNSSTTDSAAGKWDSSAWDNSTWDL